MTITLDDATRKKLVLVKQFYQNSLRQAAAHSSIMDRIMAVIGFDLAIETALKAAAIALDPMIRARNLSNNLVGASESVFQAQGLPFPSRGNMQRVRDIRNDAQHEARYPNETDLNDSRVYTRDILNHILTNVWGVSLDTISLADLIQHDRTKQFFLRAEQALARDDYSEAAMQAIAGLQRALGLVRAAFVGRDPSKGEPRIATEFETMIERMRATLLYQALGIDYADTVRLDQTVGHVIVTSIDAVHLDRRDGLAPIDRSLAESALSYCVDTVVQIEQRVGDLGAPFGIEYWF